jgi:hypothetical protein
LEGLQKDATSATTKHGKEGRVQNLLRTLYHKASTPQTKLYETLATNFGSYCPSGGCNSLCIECYQQFVFNVSRKDCPFCQAQVTLTRPIIYRK